MAPEGSHTHTHACAWESVGGPRMGRRVPEARFVAASVQRPRNSCRTAVGRQSHSALPLEAVRLLLPLGPKLAHRGCADHDVCRLLEPAEDAVLHIRHAVLGADGAELRCRLLVGEHRELRPKVVLNLVVEPAVHKVVGIGRVAVHRPGGAVGPDAVGRAEVD
eukprot:scaffold31044_cov112-Isochrysis_galbana.AAC.4